MTKLKQKISSSPLSFPKHRTIYVPALYSLKQLNKMSGYRLIDADTLSIQSFHIKREDTEDDTERKLVIPDEKKSLSCVDIKQLLLPATQLYKKEYIEEETEEKTDIKLEIPGEKKSLSCMDIKEMLLPSDQYKKESVDELIPSENNPTFKGMKMSEYEYINFSEGLDKKSNHVEEEKRKVKNISHKIPTTTKIDVLIPDQNINQNTVIQNNTKPQENIEKNELVHKEKIVTYPKVGDCLALDNKPKISREIMITNFQKERLELLKEVEQVEIKMKSLIKKDEQINELNKKVKYLTGENKRLVELQEKKLTNENKIMEIKREELSAVEKLLQSEKDKVLEMEVRETELSNENDKLLELNSNYKTKINSLKSELETIIKEKEELAEQNKCLVEDISLRENKICNIDEQNTMNMNKVSALRSELDNILREKVEKRKKRKEKKEKRKNKRRNEKEILVLQSTVSKIKMSLSRKRLLNTKLQNKVDQLEKTIDDKTKICQNLQSVLHIEENKASGLELQFAELSHKNMEISELNLNYGLQVDTLKADLVEKEIKFRKKEKESEDNQQKLLIQNRYCEDLTKKIQDLQNLLNLEKENALELNNNYHEKMKSLKSDMETALKEKAELFDQNKCLVSDVSVKENEIIDTKKRYDKLLEETDEEKTKNFEKLQNLLHSEENNVNKLNLQITELSNNYDLQVNTLKAELAEEKMNNLSLKRNLEILYNEKDARGKENEELNANASYEKVKKELTDTKESLLRKEKELEQWKKAFEDKNGQLNKMKNNNIQLKKISRSFREKLTLTEEELKKIKEEKDAADATIKSLQEKNMVSENEQLQSPIGVAALRAKNVESEALVAQSALEIEIEKRNIVGEVEGEKSTKEIEVTDISSDQPSTSKSSKPSEMSNTMTCDLISTSTTLDEESNNTAPRKRENASEKPLPKPGKIYVGNVPIMGLSLEDIRNYFSQYGKVEKVHWPFNRAKNTLQNFCFVHFDSEKITEKLIQKGSCQIMGRFGWFHTLNIKPVHTQNTR